MYYSALKFQTMEQIVRNNFGDMDKDNVSEDDIIDLLEDRDFNIEEIFEFLNYFKL